MKKSFPYLVFSNILLSILLILSIYLGFNGNFYKRTTVNSNLDIMAGDSSIIEVDANKAFAKTFVVDGSYLGGQTIPQNIDILSRSQNIFVRAKLQCENPENFYLLTSEKFTFEDDGYFYFNDILSAGEKTTLTNGIKILPEAKLQSGKKYVLTIVVETLEENAGINLLWKN